MLDSTADQSRARAWARAESVKSDSAAPSPLFPFGYGLSYTSFALSPAAVQPRSLGSSHAGRLPREAISVSVAVRNSGARAGDEVVMVFASVYHRSVTRPVQELVAFARVSLAAGEAKQLHFRVPTARLLVSGVI